MRALDSSGELHASRLWGGERASRLMGLLWLLFDAGMAALSLPPLYCCRYFQAKSGSGRDSDFH